MKKKNFDELIDEAIKNIREDRQEAKDLLKDLVVYISQDNERHRECGFTLAKYLETLQRSNEQLVKISSIIKKKEDENSDLSDEDRNNIFEQLNSAVKPDKKGKNK